jgi:hypothetical protein
VDGLEDTFQIALSCDFFYEHWRKSFMSELFDDAEEIDLAGIYYPES